MHFTLYSPPARLVSSVSLSAHLLPAGGLALSPLVQSVTIFRSDSAPRHHLMLLQVSRRLCSRPGRRAARAPSAHLSSAFPQLASLALALTHLCLQLYRLAEKGVRGYWREPGNWLEVAALLCPSQTSNKPGCGGKLITPLESCVSAFPAR